MGLARSGLMLAAGEPDMPPLQIAGGIADQMGAIMLAYGVLAALLARERFGIGQEVDASHLGSMIWLQGLSVAARLMMGFAIPRMPRKYASNPLWNHYQCGDGKWICLGMLQPDRYWADSCRVLGRPELATDERFATCACAPPTRRGVEILDAIFATKPRAEWLAILRRAATSSSPSSTASTSCPTIRRCRPTSTSPTSIIQRSARPGRRHPGASAARRPARCGCRPRSSASTRRR